LARAPPVIFVHPNLQLFTLFDTFQHLKKLIFRDVSPCVANLNTAENLKNLPKRVPACEAGAKTMLFVVFRKNMCARLCILAMKCQLCQKTQKSVKICARISDFCYRTSAPFSKSPKKHKK